MAEKLTLLRRIVCAFGACQTFSTQSDDSGVWGECHVCGKQVGFVTREELRRYCDQEVEAEMARRALEDRDG